MNNSNLHSKSFDLLALGECMVELRADGPLGEAAVLTRAYGGDVLNSLVAAARAGSRCGFITRVGNDPFGVGLRSAWAREGIDLTCAPLVDGENGVYFISLLAGGEREFTYRRAVSAASGLSPDDIQPDYLASARTLLLSGITQAISASAQAATLEAARLAHERGVTVAYDPNYRPRLWAERGGVSAARATLREVLPFTDILLPSFPADMELLDDTPRTPAEVITAWRELQPGLLVALKAGGDGAYLSGKGHVPAEPVADVLDTTGAGDTWNGAFLHALGQAQGGQVQTPAQAAAFAHRAAAHAIRHRGAIAPREETHRD